MITELTAEQESKIELYLKKWLDVGYRTKEVTQAEAENAARFLYGIADMEMPKYVVVLDSPWECQLACNLLGEDDKIDAKIDAKIYAKISAKIYDKLRAKISDKIYDKLRDKIDAKINAKIYDKIDDKIDAKIYDKIDDKLRDKIDAKLRAKISDKIYDKIRDKIDAKIYDKIDDKLRDKIDAKIYAKISAKIYDKLRAKISDKIYAKIYDKIDDKLRAKISDKIYDKIRDKIDEQNLTRYYSVRSNMWNAWYARLDYLFNEVIPDDSQEGKNLNNFLSSATLVHQIYCFEDICFVSDFPTEININSDGELHHTDRPALTYKDGFSLYFSNGIEMHEKYILTPADQITKEDFVSEENADMKREIIRKVGLARVMEMLEASVLDTMETKRGGKYELLSCSLSDEVTGKYLKMKCPSTGNVHILGVTNDAKTALDGYRDLNNGLEPQHFIWEA